MYSSTLVQWASFWGSAANRWCSVVVEGTPGPAFTLRGNISRAANDKRRTEEHGKTKTRATPRRPHIPKTTGRPPVDHLAAPPTHAKPPKVPAQRPVQRPASAAGNRPTSDIVSALTLTARFPVGCMRWFGASADRTVSSRGADRSRPIFHPQAGNSFKVNRISRQDRQPARQGDGTDSQIHRSNPHA